MIDVQIDGNSIILSKYTHLYKYETLSNERVEQSFNPRNSNT